MDVHAHGGTPDSYLSGNMHFDDYQTKTFYRSSFDPESKIGLPNKKGGCVIFQVIHNTTQRSIQNQNQE